MEKLTEDELNIHTALTNLNTKVLIAKCFLVLIFLITLYVFFWPADWQTKTGLAFLDSVLAFTVKPMVSHYFPAFKPTIDAEKKKRKPSIKAQEPPAAN